MTVYYPQALTATVAVAVAIPVAVTAAVAAVLAAAAALRVSAPICRNAQREQHEASEWHGSAC